MKSIMILSFVSLAKNIKDLVAIGFKNILVLNFVSASLLLSIIRPNMDLNSSERN